MAQNAQIDRVCVTELLALLMNDRWNDYQCTCLLQQLIKKPQLIQGIDTPAGEQACVDSCGPYYAGGKRDDIRAMIRELCNYPSDAREQILHAALNHLNQEFDKRCRADSRAEARTHTARRLKRGIRALSLRERALLKVISEIETTDGPEGVDLLNYWRKLVRGASLKPLREDPTCADLLELYDIIRAM